MTKPIVTISDDALSNIRDLLVENEMEDYGLYIGIRGGGCSGYSYQLEFIETPSDEDLVYKYEGVSVFVGPLKREYLSGTVIDYKDTLMEAGFKILNPNAKRACGCGESFDIHQDEPPGAGAF
ncbi:MAG: iron-sulfur cluster assembly accessory protein [Proteobacteria bacterium]|nr:iron-sulfur cluster assembly accessory protein [Pseudomonadota bacterium]MCP4919444.1 iron-sulfur cluster assembly accessory protein [Pseudomonadota bacterium]